MTDAGLVSLESMVITCLMALYTTSGANASTGLALYEEAVRTSDVVPQGYLTVTKDDERVLLLHSPMVFAASAAQDARGWEDQVLMFVDDVCDNQLPPHVALPKQLLAIQTNKAKVAKWGECVLHCATSEADLQPIRIATHQEERQPDIWPRKMRLSKLSRWDTQNGPSPRDRGI
jgi:hypothetical protein